MQLVQQWREAEQALPAGWREARLSITTESPGDLPRAAAVLGPASPGRIEGALVVTVRAGGYPGPEHVRRLLGRVDEARLWGTLAVLGVEEAARGDDAGAAPAAISAAVAWDAELAALPSDWSDLLCSLEVDSSDHLPRAALLCAPINPTRDRSFTGFTFRCARRTGYGVSPEMARRCFGRLDEEEIPARVGVLRILSDTRNVATQGAVWYVGGKVL